MRKLAAIVALWTSLPVSLPVHAGPLRISLPAETTVQGDTIVLAHLLPANVADGIRRRAEGVAIGRAPQAGGARVLSRAMVLVLLNEARFAASEFSVPDSIVVRRDLVSVDRERIWALLSAAANARGIDLPKDSCAQEIRWAAPLTLLDDESKVEVQDVHFDKLLNQARFRIRSLSNPKAPSFSAWCPLSDGQPLLPGKVQANATVSSSGEQPVAAEIVCPRRLATLQLRSLNSFATLRVRPLQSGRLGQLIRVRVPSNGHTLVARVAGPDLLEAVF